MNTEEAFKAIQRQAPCAHDSADTSLGNGRVWAKCYYCGVTFPQDGVMRARDAARTFDDAIDHLRALVADGMGKKDARIAGLEQKLAELRAAVDMLRDPMAKLLEMHPDDLRA